MKAGKGPPLLRAGRRDDGHFSRDDGRFFRDDGYFFFDVGQSSSLVEPKF
jgi:hypothetical protein